MAREIIDHILVSLSLTTDSRSCILAGFNISGVETSDTASTVLFGQLCS